MVTNFSRMDSDGSTFQGSSNQRSNEVDLPLLGLSGVWSGKVPFGDEHLAATPSLGLGDADRSSSADLRGVGSISWSLAQQISLTQQTRKKTSFFQTNTPPPTPPSHRHQLPTVHVIVTQVLFIIPEVTKREKETFRCTTDSA